MIKELNSEKPQESQNRTRTCAPTQYRYKGIDIVSIDNDLDVSPAKRNKAKTDGAQ